MNNGISPKAPAKEKIESDFESLIRGMYELGKKEATTWHPYPKEKPKSYTKAYLVTIVKHYGKHQVKSVEKDTWADSKTGGEWETFDNSHDTEVTAWAELPEPYRSEVNND